MIIFFFFILLIMTAATSAVSDTKLINNDFTSEITNNGITLNGKYKIKYETLKETGKFINNYQNLYFDNINYGKDYSINSISSNLKEDNLSVNFIYETANNYTVFVNDMKNLVKYEEDKLYVSMYIDNWNFKKYNNNLTFDFYINTDSFYNNNTITFSDFKIDFNEHSIIDGEYAEIYLLKVSNKYRITLPYFENHLYYDFVISYS